MIYKRYAKHQLPGKQTRYFDEEWQDEYNLTVFSEDRNIIEKEKGVAMGQRENVISVSRIESSNWKYTMR